MIAANVVRKKSLNLYKLQKIPLKNTKKSFFYKKTKIFLVYVIFFDYFCSRICKTYEYTSHSNDSQCAIHVPKWISSSDAKDT